MTKDKFAAIVVFLFLLLTESCSTSLGQAPITPQPTKLVPTLVTSSAEDKENLDLCDFQFGTESTFSPCSDNESGCFPRKEEMSSGASPNIVWSNPYSCGVQEWSIQIIRDDPSYGNARKIIQKYIESSVLEFGLPFELQPNTRYQWIVSPSEYLWGVVPAATHHSSYFWTGPICEIYQLQPPDIFRPKNREEINFPLGIEIQVAHPGDCGAELYEYQISESPEFLPPYYKGVYGSSVPVIDSLGFELLDCTRFHWRIRGLSGDGQGPWSEPHTFFTNFSSLCSAGLALEEGFSEGYTLPQIPYAIPIRDVDCLRGISSGVADFAALSSNKLYEVHAINSLATQVKVYDSSLKGTCWTLAEMLDFGEGDLTLDPLSLVDRIPVEIAPSE